MGGGDGNGGREEEGRVRSEREGTPRGWFTPHVRKPEKYLPDRIVVKRLIVMLNHYRHLQFHPSLGHSLCAH